MLLSYFYQDGFNKWDDHSDKWTISIPIAGAKKEDIKINLINQILSLDFDGNEFTYPIRKEYGVPPGTHAKDIHVSYEAGVLNIEVDKPEESKPSQIKIN